MGLKMTAEDYAAYRKLVQRKGKALQLSAEELEPYRSRFDEICVSVKIGFKPYLAYAITGGRNDLKKDTELMEKVRSQREIYKRINGALRDGDLFELDCATAQLRRVYESMD